MIYDTRVFDLYLGNSRPWFALAGLCAMACNPAMAWFCLSMAMVNFVR